MSTGRGILGFRLTTGLDSNRSWLGQEGYDVDHVVHGLPTIGSAHEVVSAAIVCGSSGGGVGRVTVESAKSPAVPVDDLVLPDVVVDGRGTGLVSGNERLGKIQPSIVGPERYLDQYTRRSYLVPDEGRGRNLHVINPL